MPAPYQRADVNNACNTAVACTSTGTRKFDRGLGQILHDQLHWLDVPGRVLFKLAVTVHQCLNGSAPPYLSDLCIQSPVLTRTGNCVPPTVSASDSFSRFLVLYKFVCMCVCAFPAQHLRPSGVLSCWPDGLELSLGFYPGSNEQHRLFSAST